MLDWIDRQPWSNGRVALWGASYEATSAFFTSLLRHPTVVRPHMAMSSGAWVWCVFVVSSVLHTHVAGAVETLDARNYRPIFARHAALTCDI